MPSSTAGWPARPPMQHADTSNTEAHGHDSVRSQGAQEPLSIRLSGLRCCGAEDQVLLLGMAREVRADERTHRDKLQPSGPDVAKSRGDEAGPEPTPLEVGVDLRVDQHD